jgi:hypothetical protein
MLDSTSTPRPPRRSTIRPTAGPANAAISKALERAPKTHDLGTPTPALIGPARMAGK